MSSLFVGQNVHYIYTLRKATFAYVFVYYTIKIRYMNIILVIKGLTETIKRRVNVKNVKNSQAN